MQGLSDDHADTSVDRLLAENERLRDRLRMLEARYLHVAQQNYSLEQQATTDSMTGLANHRAFQEEIRAEFARAKRHSQPLSLLMLDVDHFKQYNDRFGHPAGDHVLRAVGALLQSGTRTGDFVARYGGEEFAIILPATDFDTAVTVAERLRVMIQSHNLADEAVTASIGVAEADLAAEGVHNLVGLADEALYVAKARGRNRVCAMSGAHRGDGDSAAVPGDDDEADSDSSGPAVRRTEIEDADQFGGLEGILQDAAGPVLGAVLSALDIRDNESPGHPQRVARYALRLAAAVADVLAERQSSESLVPLVTPSDLRDLAIGALLHDIGNVRMPDHILRKTNDLSPHEVVLLRRHPRLGAAMIGDVPIVRHALPVVKYHHERWDGQGYPFGLAGEDIPLSARIFSVCDAFDSMTSDQPYRRRLDFVAAREEIRANSGRQFDPTVVEAFFTVPEEEWLSLGNGVAASSVLSQAA